MRRSLPIRPIRWLAVSVAVVGLAVSAAGAAGAYTSHPGAVPAKAASWKWTKGVKLPDVKASSVVSGLSCPSTKLCVATATISTSGAHGNNGVWWTTNPLAKKPKWHYERINAQKNGGQTLYFISGAITCNVAGSHDECAIASGGNIWQTSNPTKGWGGAAIDTYLLEGEACWVNVHCLSSDDQGYILTTEGATVLGSAQPILPPSGSDLGTALGCAPYRSGRNPFCVEVAGNSQIAYSTDPASGTWHAGKVHGAAEIDEVSCATNTLCVFSEDLGGAEPVVGVSSAPKGGESWIKTVKQFAVPESVAGFVGGVTAVDCNRDSLCLASGNGAKGNFVLVSTRPTAKFSSWKSYKLNDGKDSDSGAGGIACPTDKFCLIVSQEGRVVQGRR